MTKTKQIKVAEDIHYELMELKAKHDFRSINQLMMYLLECEEKYSKAKIVRLVEE